MRKVAVGSWLAVQLLLGRATAGSAQELVGYDVLPADTFSEGPTSGQFIGAANGVMPPFVDRQPVQGFSSILHLSDGRYLVLSDNGYGRQENSPDYLLRIYRLQLYTCTGRGRTEGGPRAVRIDGFVQLRDPHRKIPWPIVADLEMYPGSGIPVSQTIRAGRLLTGADFDPESFRRMPDGSFWIGDEFGPFLLHVDAEGTLLEPPIPLEGVASPQDPLGRPTTLPRSAGFEGMSASSDLGALYPMLERPIAGQDSERELLRIFEFDPTGGRFTGRTWLYRLEPDATAIGDFAPIGDSLHAVIERDRGEGAEAKLKKLFLVDLGEADSEGVLLKRELVDLLAIRDPHDLNADGETTFRMPFETIEGVARTGEATLAVVNDNNYPFSAGRRPNVPDDNEIVCLEFERLPASLP